LSFSKILGHKRQIEVLKRSVASGQLPPAYLFHGDEGIGKRLVANELAKAVNCTGGHAPGESCGGCRNCKNIDAGCHPNVSHMAIETNEKTGKPRQEIVIDQVRRAQEYLSLSAVGEGRKVLIVDGAHQMNEEAANAFLKTLEEPPEGSHIVLVTSRPSYLLPTIMSRSRAVGFAPLSEADVAGALMDKKGMGEADALLVARMTGGRLGSALDTDPAELYSRRAEFIKLLDVLAGGDDAKALAKADELTKTDYGLDDVVFFGTLWFRDLLVISVGGGVEMAYNRDVADELYAWADRTTAYRCEAALLMLGGAGRSLERTYNRRLMAEDLFFRIREEALAGPALRA